MNPFKNLFKSSKAQKGANTRELGKHLDSFPSFVHDADIYENVYASVRPIVNRFTDIEPYALDIRGKKVESSTVDAIYRPNDKMGFTQFLDALAVGVLTQPEVNILVWRKEGRRVLPGGKLRKDNVAGYTFINRWTTDVYGKRVYERQTQYGTETFTDDEVITLVHSRNPRDLTKGYSPTAAARRWTKIDDLIADYQAGYFNNSAVPAGMFIITAPTAQEYRDIVTQMKAHHQGASKNSNVMYSYQELDKATGKPAQASITWVPFNVTNKDLELGVLFDNTNKKIDSSFAVPAVMRGVDSNSTYSNANVSKREFVEGVIEPFTKNIWSQWTHEMNRITGGIEAVIKFDLVIPAVVDEDKVIEETKKIRDDRIKQYIDLGYSLESIKSYLDTDDITALEKAPVEAEEELEVADETTDLATQEDSNPVVIYRSVEAELHCKECDRFLGTTKQLEYSDKLKCSNSKCKALEVPTVKEAAKADTLKAKALDPQQLATYQTQLEDVAREFMLREVDKAIERVDGATKATEEEVDEFTDEAMKVIVSVLVISGAIQYSEGIAMLLANGFSTQSSQFVLSDSQVDRYRKYLKNVGKSYSSDTQTAIQAVLDQANVDGWTSQQVKEQLADIMRTNDYRVKRLARSEINRSQQIGSQYSVEQIEGEADVKFTKTWTTTSANPCPICQSLSGKTIPVSESFLGSGESIELKDGEQWTNNFVSMESAQAHPNDFCMITFNVVKD